MFSVTYGNIFQHFTKDKWGFSDNRIEIMITDNLHIRMRPTGFLLLIVFLSPLVGGRLARCEPSSPSVASRPVLSSPTASATDLPRRSCDIVLLMDSSGSMKQSDPHDYRKDAAKLFISLVDRDDRISVISFGDSATLLLPLTMNAAENRPALFRAAERITSREFSTNILDAVQQGYNELKASTAGNRVLIMLSDGKLALGSPEKDAAALAGLRTLLPELRATGVKLYTVAFTEESDSALLEKLAQETAGFFRFAKTDNDVHAIFASIFEKLKTPDAVPFEGESFTIDGEIKEAIVLVTKKPGTAVALVDPLGAEHRAARHAPAFQWYASNVFDMITVSAPVAGKWAVKLSTNEGNRVYVLTDLSLKSSFDRSFVSRGETVSIDAWLERQGTIVTDKNLVDVAAFSARVTGPDAKTVVINLPGRAGGRHVLELPVLAPGEYLVDILVDGKAFQRERTLWFKTVDAPAPVKSIPLRTPLTPPAGTTQEGIPWTTVLVQFGLINLAAIVLGSAFYYGRKLFRQRKVKIC